VDVAGDVHLARVQTQRQGREQSGLAAA
jgi:hypothetical protein